MSRHRSQGRSSPSSCTTNLPTSTMHLPCCSIPSAICAMRPRQPAGMPRCACRDAAAMLSGRRVFFHEARRAGGLCRQGCPRRVQEERRAQGAAKGPAVIPQQGAPNAAEVLATWAAEEERRRTPRRSSSRYCWCGEGHRARDIQSLERPSSRGAKYPGTCSHWRPTFTRGPPRITRDRCNFTSLHA